MPRHGAKKHLKDCLNEQVDTSPVDTVNGPASAAGNKLVPENGQVMECDVAHAVPEVIHRAIVLDIVLLSSRKEGMSEDESRESEGGKSCLLVPETSMNDEPYKR